MQEMNTFWRLGLAVSCAAGAAWLKLCSGVKNENEASGISDGLRGVCGRSGTDRSNADNGANAPMRANETQHGTVIDMEAYFTSLLIANWARRHDLYRSSDVRVK